MNRIVQFGVSAVAAAAIGIGAGSGIAAAFDDGHQFPDQIGGDVVGEPAQRAIGVGFVSGVAELDDGDGTGCCQNERHGGAEDEGESPSDGPLSGGAHAVLRPCAAGIRHREWFPAR